MHPLPPPPPPPFSFFLSLLSLKHKGLFSDSLSAKELGGGGGWITGAVLGLCLVRLKALMIFSSMAIGACRPPVEESGPENHGDGGMGWNILTHRGRQGGEAGRVSGAGWEGQVEGC